MNKKTLQILADADNKRIDAEMKFLETLPYDDGSVITRHSGKYYDFGGVMSGINSVAKSVLDDSLDTTYDDLKKQKDYNNRSVLQGVSDNDALLMAMDNLQWGQEYKDKDFRSVSVWDDVSDTVMGGISGAMATKSPWGLLAAVPVAGNKIVNRLRARNERIKANSDIDAFNSRLSNMLSSTAGNVDTMNDRRLLEAYYNSAAFGGELSTHGADWDNGLTQINTGGTHGENPYGGVPAGTDEQGVPNLVEEGEVIWDNQYVFSNRIKVPKALLNKYKLGGLLTFAEAIKKVTRESEERKNDPISNATTKAIVNEFIDSQEEIRMKKQQRAAAKVQQAQFEEDLLGALAGLSGEPQPLAPMDVQAPVQQVPQEAPVIEQMGAYGGRFDTGGPKRKGLDPLLTKQFPEDHSLLEYLMYKYDAEHDPTMPEVYPYNFKTRVQAKRAYNAERDRIKALELRQRIQNSKLYKWADNIDNKYLRDTFIESPKEYHFPQITDSLFGDGENLFEDGGYFAFDGTWFQDKDMAQNYNTRNGVTDAVVPVSDEVFDSINASVITAQGLRGGDIQKVPYGRDTSLRQTYRYRTTDGKLYGNAKDAQKHQDKVNIDVAKTAKNVPGYGTAYTTLGGQVAATKKEAARLQKEENKGTITPKGTPAQYTQTVAKPVQPIDANTPIEGTGPVLPVAPKQEAQQQQQKVAQTPVPKVTSAIKAGNIPYDRSKSTATVKEFENQADYKNFLSLIRSNPEIANQWIGRLNNGDFGSLNGYQIKDIDDWYRLATDGKLGPIHNATLAAAQAWRESEATTPRREPLLPEIKNPNSLDAVLAEYNSSLKSGNKTIEKPILEAIDDEIAAPRADTNYTGLMRNAPIIGGAVQSILGLMGSPDYSNADAVLEAAERIGTPISIPVETVGDYVQRKPFDERYLVNMANQNRAAASRNAANTAGGNRAMQLGADAFLAHSNQQELGEIMRQAYLANRQDMFSTAEFNRGTNLQNMSAINSRNLAQAQLNTQRQQAGLSGIITGRNMRQNIYDRDVATTGANLSNLFNNIGLRGKEMNMENTIQSMVDEGYFNYGYNPDGSFYFKPTEKLTSLYSKNGGKLKKKRRF